MCTIARKSVVCTAPVARAVTYAQLVLLETLAQTLDIDDEPGSAESVSRQSGYQVPSWNCVLHGEWLGW
jgi:hypothetical protein